MGTRGEPSSKTVMYKPLRGGPRREGPHGLLLAVAPLQPLGQAHARSDGLRLGEEPRIGLDHAVDDRAEHVRVALRAEQQVVQE